MPFGDEIGQHRLVKMRRIDVHGVAHGQETIDQVGWQDEITDPQRREQHLTECPDVNHARSLVKALQRRHRLGFVTIFAVVIVFDDPGTRAAGPLQQRKTPRGAHSYAEWKLVRWGDECGARSAAAPNAGRYVQSFSVYRNR